MPEKIQAISETFAPPKEPVAVFLPNVVYEIDVAQISVSPFVPQAMRRARFDQAELDSLSDSIRKYRLREPIQLRPVAGDQPFQIVFGERRFLASRRNGAVKIAAFVEELTDAQVLELQYEENHRHQKNEPLIDALYFKQLKENEGYTDEDLADRLNTKLSNVREKLKLNDLIDEAKEELGSGALPLKHAYYLAKFPRATQAEIVRAGYAYRHYDADEKAASFEVFREEVEENIVRRLLGAPFDVADGRLHVYGLLCRDCPDNSAKQTHLFPELADAARCLNKPCFELKTGTHLRLKREELAWQKPQPPDAPAEDVIKSVPLVTERKWTDEKPTFPKEKILTDQKLQDAPECEFSEISLAVDGARKGQSVWICRHDGCPRHHPKPLPPVSEKLDQLEERFNLDVAEEVRLRTLLAATAFFDQGNKTFWQFDDLVARLIGTALFEFGQANGSDLRRILRAKFGKEVPNLDYPERIAAFVAGLDGRARSQILLLLALSSATDEIEIAQIAQDYGTPDYLLTDAEVRLELAPDEFKPRAAEHLAAVKNGEPADVPKFWTNYDDVPEIGDEEN